MMEATVSKGEFADLIGVTAGRVSQMIKAGQITSASLAGDGRSARIILDKARADLRRNLDPAQSHGLNGMATRSALADRPTVAPPASTPESPRKDAPASDAPRLTLPLDNTADLIGREKLRQAEIATRRMEREEALEEGRFVLADDAKAAIAASASKLLSTFESGLSDMADAIAADHGIPPRDALHTLTRAFRAIRETAAQTFAGQREAILAAEAEALARLAEEDTEDEDSA